MEVKKERNSNFELMRIITMFMIVLWHFIRNGPMPQHIDGSLKIILIFLNALIEIHICSFVLLSGYFQYNKKMKLSKVITLNNSIWFYKALIPIILISLGLVSIDKITFLKLLSPIPHKDYWYMTTYLILYLISPLLNIIIENTNKRQHKLIIIMLILLFCILSIVTNEEFYKMNYGYSLTNFIMLYFIGSFLHKYPIEKSTIFKSKNKEYIRFISIITFFTMAFIAAIIEIASTDISSTNGIVGYFGYVLHQSFTAYNNPILILQAISYFIFFSTLNFKSKMVNNIAKTCLGIYLIHDNEYLITFIFKIFNMYYEGPYKITLFSKIFIISIITFLGCMLIELVRQFIFKLIKNLKISKRINKNISNQFNNLLINIQ